MEEKESKKSFFIAQKQNCPVCSATFQVEELLTGRGRLNADTLTDELHRLFQSSEKHGEIHPLIYPVWTCPQCYYSAIKEDFFKLKEQEVAILQKEEARKNRREAIDKVFSNSIDFTRFRRLEEGIAAYICAMYSYSVFPSKMSPVLKQGISALRAAWLATHLQYQKTDQNYDYLARVLYHKAAFFYEKTLQLDENGEQALRTSRAINYGPDIDHNFGFDGILYLAHVLRFKYAKPKEIGQRMQSLEKSKIVLAKLFGKGESSQKKPIAILNLSRKLYTEITAELKSLKRMTGESKNI